MRSVLCFIIYALISSTLFAQKEATYWYFDQFYGLSFASGKPVFLSDGRINTPEGCAVVSDRKTGELLFYTDGVIVRNRIHEIMPNGTGLKGGPSSTQSALIVPKPLNDKEYYIITAPDVTGNDGNTHLHYSKVSLNTLQGNIIEKNIKLIDSVGEKLSGTVHCNPYEYWIITHHRKKAIFYAFRVTKNGIDTVPVVSDFGDSYISAVAGYLKISPNGKKIALGVGVLEIKSELYLFDFDKSTGKVTNRKKIDEGNASSFYGLSFSPNNGFLYTSNNGAVQYDISSNNAQTIAASKVAISQLGHGAFQIAPDKKIYVAMGQSLGIIQKPNEKGNLCDVKEDGIKISCRAGLPNFMDYLFNDTKDLECGSYSGILIGDSSCVNEELIVTHKDSRNIQERKWLIDSGEVVLVSDTTCICKFIKAGSYRVRLIVKSEYTNDTLFKNVTVIDKPKAVAGNDTIICRNPVNNIRIGYPPIKGYTYSWKPEKGLSNPRISNPTVTVSENTTYILTVTNSLDCISYDTIHISLQEPPKITVSTASGRTTLCRGDTIQLFAEGADTFLWQSDNSLNKTDIFNPFASPKTSTTYYVKGTTGNCASLDSLTIIVQERPIIVKSRDTTICEGNSVQLFAGGAEKYLWEPTTGLDKHTISTPTATPLITTKYYVYATSGSCTVKDSISINVEKNPSVTIRTDTAICLGDSVQLTLTGYPVYSYKWSPSTFIDNSSKQNPIVFPRESTKYSVTVTHNNCSIRKDISINVKQPQKTSIDLYSLNDTTYSVGSSAPLTIDIPKGVHSISFTISFDDCCASFQSLEAFRSTPVVLSNSKGNIRISTEIKDGKGDKITLRFLMLLPSDTRISQAFSLGHIVATTDCLELYGSTTKVQYNPSCAWNLRGVQTFEKFDVMNIGNTVVLFSGAGGNTVFDLFTFTGEKIWTLTDNVLPSAEKIIELPELSHGLFIFRVHNYQWKKEIILCR